MGECLICKKHFSQGGKCKGNLRYCRGFEEEPRGKMIYTTLNIEFFPEMPVFMKRNEKVILSDNREFTILDIIAVNFVENFVRVRGCYHESEKTPEVRRNELVILKGGK